MAGVFDPLDRDSWYFGPITREESQQILKEEREGGVFLVRDSISCPGDSVLCVKEDNRVSHYIINKIQEADKSVYRIGEQDFPSLPDLLTFYKFHYLDSTPLIRPATRKLEQVITKYEFSGRDVEDLPFHRGEVLTIVRKDEEQWWTAKNAQGQIGSIPVTYVHKYDPKAAAASPQNGTRAPQRPSSVENPAKVPTPRDLPAMAKVIKDRVSVYDDSQLRIKVGDIIEVTKTNSNGWWEGNVDGKSGSFPATYIEWVEEQDPVRDAQ